ncbi:reticulon-1-like [Sinocyclocheilus grahami]|nr:PREDICTED: reticulon-1-like [Sinocyclocheilus grahami]
MSAKSSEGPGLDGKWFDEVEEEEKNGMFGSAGPRFDEMRDDLHAPKQQFHPFEGSGVAMETASTGDSLSDMFMKSSSGEGDLYTSLLSSKSSSNPFNDGASLFSTGGNRSPPAPTGTDSGIGMTPGDPSDHQTTLQGSHKTDHYSYMDMGDDLCDFGSVGNTKNKQQPAMSGYGDDEDNEEDEDDIQDFKPKIHEKESSHDPFDLGRYLEKSPLGSEDTGVKSPGSAGGQHTFPYVEDPSDEETLPTDHNLRKGKEKDDSSERNVRGREDMEKGKKECNWSSWRGQVMGGSVVDLLHWRDLKQSGLVFGSVLLLLFSLTQFSVVSVIAYLALAVLSATISFRVYKSVLQAVQKTDEGHPFKAYLEVEIALSADQIIKYVDKTQLYINSTMKELRRLFLVQDMVDSIKFAVLMWLLTYVGALFNGLTLLILVVVSMFSVPVVYEKYQTQIDQYLGLVRTQFNSIMGKIREKVPGAKKKE